MGNHGRCWVVPCTPKQESECVKRAGGREEKERERRRRNRPKLESVGTKKAEGQKQTARERETLLPAKMEEGVLDLASYLKPPPKYSKYEKKNHIFSKCRTGCVGDRK